MRGGAADNDNLVVVPKANVAIGQQGGAPLKPFILIFDKVEEELTFQKDGAAPAAERLANTEGCVVGDVKNMRKKKGGGSGRGSFGWILKDRTQKAIKNTSFLSKVMISAIS